jgi:chromosome segregation ATPase
MNLSSLFPHTIVTRLLDDLGAVAEAARRLPELERAVLARVDTMQRELSATRGAVEPLAGQLDQLEARLAPIEELSAVRAGVEALDGRLAPIEELPAVRAGVEALGDQLGPIGELPAVRAGVERLDARLAPIEQLTPVRAAVEPLSDQLERLAEIVTPIRDIEEVRKGIEPLDEDMHAVRHSVDDLEPLMREVIGRLEALRADLSPLGDLADKIPGIG